MSRRSSLPKLGDSPALFAHKRDRLLNRVIPMTLIPMASANGMLVIGSQMTINEKKVSSCYFKLPQFLVYGGALSLSLVVLAIVAKYVLEFVLADGHVSTAGKVVVHVLEYLSTLLAIIQVVMVMVGSVIVYPQLSSISDDVESEHYCQYGPVVFAGVLLTLSWIFILFGLGCYVYIKWNQSKKLKSKNLSKKASLTRIVEPQQEKVPPPRKAKDLAGDVPNNRGLPPSYADTVRK